MNSYSNSWYPLKNFCKSPCHKDYMVGVTKRNSTDYLYPDRTIRKYETVIWNRSLGIMSISLDNYKEAVSSGDNEMLKKLESIGLPLDVKM